MSPRGLAAVAAVLLAACGSTAPTKPHVQEVCTNGVDDNGDGKVDCLDPDCFTNAACTAAVEVCDNGVDDDGNGLIDCADPACDAKACGAHCLCRGGKPTSTGAGGGTAAGGGAAAGGGTGGGSATGGGGPSCATCGAGCQCVNGAAVEFNCVDGLDNDRDNLVDCEDPDCAGITCGVGCKCGAGAKREVNCGNGVDDDGDGKIDCADPDCVGAGTEVCDDGVDNTCDHAIDCGDPKCSGSPACASLADGKPCLTGTQCLGGTCFTEAATGVPNGTCGPERCDPMTNDGCHTGLCAVSRGVQTCWARCSGTGTGLNGCRPGFSCFDSDGDPKTDNSYCLPNCSTSEECAGAGSGYGCNPWRRTCGNLDRGLAKYGGMCTSNADCETGACNTKFPGGYCVGFCRADLKACGAGGTCLTTSAGDNTGLCEQTCGSCRTDANYYCYTPLGVCTCLYAGLAAPDPIFCCRKSSTGGVCD